MRIQNPGVPDGSITPAKLSFLNKFVALNQAADVPLTTIFTPATSGLVMLLAFCVETQAATTSSTLPVNKASWTDVDTNLATSGTWGTASTVNAVGAFNVDTVGSGGGWPVQFINAKAGVPIQVATQGYLSTGATPMQFAFHVLSLGPF